METADMGGAPVESSDFGSSATEVESGQQSVDWKESFGIAGNPSFDKFESPEALAKSYSELESYRGSSLRIPTEEAGEEVWGEFKEKISKVPGVLLYDEDNPSEVYDRLGRPQSADQYEWTPVEGFQEDPETEGAFRQVIHEAGLTRQQADQIHNWLASNIMESEQASAMEVENGIAALKGEWGAAFDQNVAMAKSAVAMIDSRQPGFADFLNETGAGNDKRFIAAMKVLGEAFGEQGAVDYSESTVMAPADARLMIEDIRNNPEHPYNNELSPGHEAAKEKVRELYKLVTYK